MPETTLNHRPVTNPAEQVRATMCATRVGFVWFGTRKSLTAAQRAQAAESFGATGAFLSAGKKLLDTKHPRYRAVTSMRNRVRSFWNVITLPYPEPGVRLIRRDTIDRFQDQMTIFKEELDEAVLQLDEQYAILEASAAERLGSLFNAADYPMSLVGLFDLSWDFPSIEPRQLARRPLTRRRPQPWAFFMPKPSVGRRSRVARNALAYHKNVEQARPLNVNVNVPRYSSRHKTNHTANRRREENRACVRSTSPYPHGFHVAAASTRQAWVCARHEYRATVVEVTIAMAR